MIARTLQTRVLALAGAGVVGAAALLSMVSRSSLSALERSIADEHERLPVSVAATLGREIADDMRLLSAAAGSAEPDAQRKALSSIVHFGRLGTDAFLVSRDGAVLMCEPSTDCAALPPATRALALRSMHAQRPMVGDFEDADGAVFAVMPFRAPETARE